MQIDHSFVIRARNDSCSVTHYAANGKVMVGMVSLEVGEIPDFLAALRETLLRFVEPQQVPCCPPERLPTNIEETLRDAGLMK